MKRIDLTSFPKKITKIACKLRKICVISLVIRKIQIKTTGDTTSHTITPLLLYDNNSNNHTESRK